MHAHLLVSAGNARNPFSNWVFQAVARVVASRPVTWLYLHVFPPIDRVLLKVSRGRVSFALGAPVLLLETVGARSGKTRLTPLVYANACGRVVLIASNGGRRFNPAWYYNLRANPQVRCTLRGKVNRYTARIVVGEERREMWNRAMEVYPGYATYAKRAAPREIPLFVLESP